jgi:hypothetical protein
MKRCWIWTWICWWLFSRRSETVNSTNIRCSRAVDTSKSTADNWYFWTDSTAAASTGNLSVWKYSSTHAGCYWSVWTSNTAAAARNIDIWAIVTAKAHHFNLWPTAATSAATFVWTTIGRLVRLYSTTLSGIKPL